MGEAKRRRPDLLEKIETESDSLHACRGIRISGYFINFFNSYFDPVDRDPLALNAHTATFSVIWYINLQHEMRKKKLFGHSVQESGNYDTHLIYSNSMRSRTTPRHAYGPRCF